MFFPILMFFSILVVAVLIIFSPLLLIRNLARRSPPFIWLYTPENTFTPIVAHDKGTGESGSQVVDVKHGCQGKVLDKSNPDPMKWRFKNGRDPDHDYILFRFLGVQPMQHNPFFTPRTNKIVRDRYTREKDDQSLHTVTKTDVTTQVPFSGEMTLVIEGSDTADKMAIDFEIDIIFERILPILSLTRLADSNAFLKSLAEAVVNDHTIIRAAAYYYGGKDVDKHRQTLTKAIRDAIKRIALKELGLRISAVSMRSVSLKPEYLKLLQLKVIAEKEGEEKVIRAKKTKLAQIELNSAEADRIERVVRPAAENSRTVAVRYAEALESQNLTHLYVGNGATPVIPLGGEELSPPPKGKEVGASK